MKKSILIILMILIFTYLVSAIPSIKYSGDTPADNAKIYSQNIFINVTSSSASNHSVFVDYDRSILGWYTMDYNSTTTFYDNSTYANSATQSGGAQLTAGTRGNAIYLDGSNDVLTIPNTAQLNQSGREISQFSLAVWARNDSTTSSAQTLFSNRVGNAGVVLQGGLSYPLLTFFGNCTGGYNYFGSNDVGDTTKYFDGTWRHIVVTFDAGVVKLYNNGVLTRTYSPTTVKTFCMPATMLIGEDLLGSNSFFHGALDEVMMWNRTLPLAEVQSLYNATKTQFKTNFTGMAFETLHTVKAYAIETDGSINSTEIRTFNVTTPDPKALPNISYSSPTPANNSIVGNLTINVSTTYPLGYYTVADFNNSLQLWMPMETNISDYFQRYAVTQSGSPVVGTGYYGNGMYLDGSSYITVTAPAIANNSDITLSAWIKPDKLVDRTTLFSNAGWGTTGIDVFIQTDVTPHLMWIVVGNSTNTTSFSVSLDTDLTVGAWRHFAVKIQDGRVFLYSNGTRMTAAARYIDPNFKMYMKNNWQIGFMTFYGAPNTFNGTMDELMIFDRGLTDYEIQNLYSSTSNYYDELYNLPTKSAMQVNVYSTATNGSVGQATLNISTRPDGEHYLISNITYNPTLHKVFAAAYTNQNVKNASPYINQNLSVALQYRLNGGAWTNLAADYKIWDVNQWSGMYGDSITSSGGNTAAFPYWLDEWSGMWQMKNSYQRGTGGIWCQTVRQNISQLATNGTSITFDCGTNDLTNGATAASIEGNYSAIFSDLRARNITVYLANILPQTVNSTCARLVVVNNWLNDYYLYNNSDGLIKGYADVYSAMKNSSACTANTSYMADTVHPNNVGANLYAKTFWQQAFHSVYYTQGSFYRESTLTQNGNYDIRFAVTNPNGFTTYSDVESISVSGITEIDNTVSQTKSYIFASMVTFTAFLGLIIALAVMIIALIGFTTGRLDFVQFISIAVSLAVVVIVFLIMVVLLAVIH